MGRWKPETGDLESWAANPRNTVDFVDLLLEKGVDFAVVLSGDVHYAFENRFDDFHVEEHASRRPVLLQRLQEPADRGGRNGEQNSSA